MLVKHPHPGRNRPGNAINLQINGYKRYAQNIFIHLLPVFATTTPPCNQTSLPTTNEKQKIRNTAQNYSPLLFVFPKNCVPLHSQTNANGAGCSSARLEYASGGRVVAGSNPVIPTDRKP